MPPNRKPPGPIPKEALAFFKAKELKPAFDYRTVWAEEHRAAFSIARVMETDVLEFMKGEVERALKEGVTFKDFADTVKDRLDRSGWADYGNGKGSKARLRVIYESNMRTARAAGQWQRIERTKDTLPYLEYALGPSARHREQHALWAGTILPVGHPFWDDHMTPNGHGCKCNILQIGRRKAERLGGVTKAPSSRKVPWENAKTGKTELVPIGVDPGWNYNPGKDRMKGPREAEEALKNGK